MYDLPGTEEVKNELALRNSREVSTPDITDLNTPEVSFDLQNFINENASQTALDDNLFELLPEKQRCYPVHQGSNRPPFIGFSMPQHSSIQANRYGSEAGTLVKQEPSDKLQLSPNGSSQSIFNTFNYSQSDSLLNPQILGTYTPNYTRPGLAGIREADSPSHNGPLKSPSSVSSSPSKNKKKNVDKSSDEYKRRRERNNIAVRKSREKAKQRSRDTERRVSDLSKENESLRKKVDTLSKELTFLKSLLSNAGISPQNIESEIARALRQELR